MAGNAKRSANFSGTTKSKTDSLVPRSPIPGSLISDEKLKMLYATMLRCRALEARLLYEEKSQPFSSTRGQEAIDVGCTVGLRAGDRIVPADRDFIFKFVHGLNRSLPSPEKIVGPSLNGRGLFGMGARLALENKKRGVVVAFSHNDRAPSRSSVQERDEALALAVAQNLPILFVVQSVPRGASARSRGRANLEDLSSQAERHGFPGIPVDGNDVVAVHRVAHESLERARRGGGPTLIECKTYRCDDQAKPSRGAKSRLEGSAHGQGHDPIQYMEQYLLRKGLFAEAWKNQVASEFARRLDEVFGAAVPAASIDP
jgi:TPP-dependent pyruvate/acetoin dehydrogenase alpha subunit